MRFQRLLVCLVLSVMLVSGCSTAGTPSPLPAVSMPAPDSAKPPATETAATAVPAPTATIAPPKLTATSTMPATAPTPEFVLQIINEDNPLNAPGSIALDTQGNIYVIDSGNSRVQKFDRDGKLLTLWGSQGEGDGQFMFASGDYILQGDVVVDALGNVYVVDDGNYRVQKFDRDGKFLAKWGSAGSDDGQFKSPASIAVDPQGNVYVTDYEKDIVQKFDPTGKFLLKWGGTGAGEGQFKGPTGIAIDPQGNIYVADNHNGRLQTYDGNGKFIAQFSWPTVDYLALNVGDITLDQAGNLYVPDGPFDRVVKFDSSGQVLTVWGSIGSDAGQFSFPSGVAIDANSNVYVTDFFNSRIQKFRQP